MLIISLNIMKTIYERERCVQDVLQWDEVIAKCN